MRDGWTETTLGDIARLGIGRTPSRNNEDYWTTDLVHPFCTIADMEEKWINPKREGVTAAAIADGKVRRAVAGSLLMSFKLTIGRVGFAARDVFPNEAIVSIDPDPTLSLKEFLYLYLGSRDLSGGSGRAVKGATLNSSSLAAISVTLPSVAEQKRIVDLMSAVDEYIAALQRQADAARAARNAVLNELLTTGGDDWVETTLGTIGASGAFIDGDWVESKDQDPDGDFRLLQLADIGEGVFLNKSDRWLNAEQFRRLRCTALMEGDILIARMPDPIARACLFPANLPVSATVVDVAILRCGPGYLPKFLVMLINAARFRAAADSLLTGTTRKRISRSNLAGITIAVPPLDKQRDIASIISSIDRVVQEAELAVDKATSLRSGLLSDLLSGEHEIPASYDRLLGAA